MDVISLAVAKKFGMKANVFKYQGSCAFEDLPTQDNEVGDVWNITDEFDLDGQHYEAGTNVAWDGEEWDALSASIDTSIFELNSNKVTTLNASSTNIQYPSAKAVFDGLGKTAVAKSIDTIRWLHDDKYFDFFSANTGIYIPCGKFEQLLYYTQRKNLTTLTGGTYWTQFLYFVKSEEINTDWETNTIIGSAMAFGNNGAIALYDIFYRNNKDTNTEYITIQQAAGNNFNYTALTNSSHLSQDILGTKNFDKLPQMKSYIAPTINTQLAPKKYVDDAIANIDISTATSEQIRALFGTEGGE